MASITVRNLEADLKERLRRRSAEHGRSMEEEAREILRTALQTETAPQDNLAVRIRKRFANLGGLELEIPPREPPDFNR